MPIYYIAQTLDTITNRVKAISDLCTILQFDEPDEELRATLHSIIASQIKVLTIELKRASDIVGEEI